MKVKDEVFIKELNNLVGMKYTVDLSRRIKAGMARKKALGLKIYKN